ncbi:MAG: diacylglycerol kinase [Nitrosomonadales bacterium SCN 54-20]|nr:MAG: diacylglycerol kinase [Nitrosomonadales bacterium SCN 54-20]
MTPRLSVLVAMARNRAIGNNNALPWRLPHDLRHFKELTMGHPIIMGRKTYESIGRLLPGRTSIIITRQPDYEVPGALVVRSIGEALTACSQTKSGKEGRLDQVNECFVIGGADIFQQMLPLCDRLYMTEIHRDFEGDTYFPEFDRNDWWEVSREEHVDDNGLEYHFVTLDRKTSQQEQGSATLNPGL